MAKKIDNPIAVSVIFGVVAIAIIIFGAAPIVAGIKNVTAQTVSYQSEIDTYDRRIANARDFISFAKLESEGLTMARAGFANAKMPLDLINSLETAAGESGIAIEFSSLPAQSSMKDDGWPSLKIEAEAQGLLDKIMNFVGKVENNKYLIEIENIVIETNPVARKKASDQEDKIDSEDETPVIAKARILFKIYVEL